MKTATENIRQELIEYITDIRNGKLKGSDKELAESRLGEKMVEKITGINTWDYEHGSLDTDTRGDVFSGTHLIMQETEETELAVITVYPSIDWHRHGGVTVRVHMIASPEGTVLMKWSINIEDNEIGV